MKLFNRTQQTKYAIEHERLAGTIASFIIRIQQRIASFLNEGILRIPPSLRLILLLATGLAFAACCLYLLIKGFK
ncbi:hypothetical protein ADIARSV_0495 [Arcticibacter svalbardensis MN12-7]|uniref:Uncharacterized protein n=1 Tax=Arcticibacter svalbardensis MN12-7 TaxID=1150600 RepID=R9GXN8_9SPHI|nr:hypothetical protein [Arcticibacter svalbardensis]EOR96260.1 hypothetical protein ADIARSV_0495 [Arcticibacter svalbardensis MN12-7]